MVTGMGKSFPLHIVAVCGHVFDDQGRMLLIKTHSRGWDSPGGQVEEGESLTAALEREIWEETGVRARVDRLVGVYSNVAGHPGYGDVEWVNTKVMMDFICTYISGEPRPSEENSETCWVTPESALERVTEPAMAYRLKQALAFDGRAHYAAYVTRPRFALLEARDF